MSTPSDNAPHTPDAQVPAARATSVDALLDGALLLEQAVEGYRFNVDSALLCAFSNTNVGRDILDVGAGVGVIGLGLATLDAEREVTLVERQASLAALARANILRNELQHRTRVVEEDIREMKGRTKHFDGAVMNPPYFQPGAGEQSPNSERALGRHQRFGDLHALVAATSRHVHSWAPVCVVYPAAGTGAVLDAFVTVGRRATVVQPIAAFEGGVTKLVIVAARQSRAFEMELLAPLVLYDAQRQYTPETAEILRTGTWKWDSSLKKRHG